MSNTRDNTARIELTDEHLKWFRDWNLANIKARIEYYHSPHSTHNQVVCNPRKH